MDAILIRQHESGIRIYELLSDDGSKNSEHRFFVVEWNSYHNQVESVVPSDMPNSGCWIARGCNASAISYVAGARTRANANFWFRKLTR